MQKQKKKSVDISWLKQRIQIRGRKVRRNTKDIVFRLVFGQDKKSLLQIYNLLNHSDLQNPEELEIVTLESAVYVVRNNDVAYLLSGRMNLYEHQSTINPNMPVRFLIYLAEEYQMYIDSQKESVYGNRLINLPTPQCIVFYNGIEKMEDESEIKLSDAYFVQEINPGVEVKVRVLNINYGHNQYLMDGCEMLKQYAEFVEILRRYTKRISDKNVATNMAIDYCIEHGILGEILRKNRSEVLGSILYEFDENKYEYSLREEAKEAGLEEGRKIGLEQGLRQGLQQGLQEGLQEGRDDGIKIFVESDRDYDTPRDITIQKLMKYYSVSEEEANGYYDKYASKSINQS